MAERGNIVVRQRAPFKGASHVFLYTHYRGSELHRIAQQAVQVAQPRWGDEAYFTRIVFDTLLDGERGVGGFGISTYIIDNEYPLILLDPVKQRVAFHCSNDALFSDPPIKQWSFTEFVALSADQLDQAWASLEDEDDG